MEFCTHSCKSTITTSAGKVGDGYDLVQARKGFQAFAYSFRNMAADTGKNLS
ncbi:MAG: hypothetical protein HGA59_01530 [Chlorobiaceae bacterium]|jgi:hypothetical protein|nr:hypothetical protein [Chlorobiaceae bacterium]